MSHLHIHVIPRYKLDVPDPRGGVRWILKIRRISGLDDEHTIAGIGAFLRTLPPPDVCYVYSHDALYLDIPFALS